MGEGDNQILIKNPSLKKMGGGGGGRGGEPGLSELSQIIFFLGGWGGRGGGGNSNLKKGKEKPIFFLLGGEVWGGTS